MIQMCMNNQRRKKLAINRLSVLACKWSQNLAVYYAGMQSDEILQTPSLFIDISMNNYFVHLLVIDNPTVQSICRANNHAYNKVVSLTRNSSELIHGSRNIKTVNMHTSFQPPELSLRKSVQQYTITHVYRIYTRQNHKQ